MKKTISILGVMLALVSFAQEPAKEEGKKDIKEMRHFLFKRMGGFVMDRREARGEVVFVNAQRRVTTNDLATAVENLEMDTWLQFKMVEDQTIDLKDIKQKMKTEKWKVAIVITDDEVLPMQTIHPEPRYAIINVAALSEGVEGDVARLAKRVRVEMMRTSASLFGCAYSSAPGGMCHPMRSPRELDACLIEHLPTDVAMSMQQIGLSLDIYPMKRCWYYNALREGWAPLPPKDEYQQSAYERFLAEQYESPSNPIRIKPGDKPKGK